MQQILIHKIQIPDTVKVLAEIFQQHNFNLYIVGGAVRDSLLGLIPKDYDLVTNATPDEIIDMCNENGFKTGEVGLHFGIVFVYINGEQYEIATFRTDGVNRKSDVTIGASREDDVMRRDFTCNGLYYDINSFVVVDSVGGIEDIKNKILRTIGIPAERFAEDPLRRLRAIRLACRYSFTMNSALIHELNDKIGIPLNVSPERMRDEFIKASMSMFRDDFTQYCQSFNHYGFMKEMLGEWYNNCKYGIVSTSYIAQIAHYIKDPFVGKIELKGWSKEEIRDIMLIQYFKKHDWNNVLKDCSNGHLYQYACATDTLQELQYIKIMSNDNAFTFQYLRNQLPDSMSDSEVGKFRKDLINNVRNLYISALNILK